MNTKELKGLIISIAKGLESSDIESVDILLINTLKQAMQVSNEVQVQEIEKIVEVEVEVPVEKLVEKEVIKEVIPSELQDELDSLTKQNQELQDEVKELQDALENVLSANDTLQARCDELHKNNEEYIKALNESEIEELSFEEPEEVSSDDEEIILKSEEQIKADEELLLNDLEANETSSSEVVEANVQEAPSTIKNRRRNKLTKSFGNKLEVSNDLDCEFEDDFDKKSVKRSHNSYSKYDSYGKERNTRRTLKSDNNNDEQTFMNYYKAINSGELNKDNLTEEKIQEIYDLAIKVNGSAPTKVLNLYFEIKGE